MEDIAEVEGEVAQLGVCEVLDNVDIVEEDSDWETMYSEVESENDFPPIDVNSENWAEDYTNSIRRFHSSGNFSNQTDVKEAKCPNCGRAFNPHHQC